MGCWYYHLIKAICWSGWLINENVKRKEETEETPFNHVLSVDIAYFVHQWALPVPYKQQRADPSTVNARKLVNK